VTDVWIAVGSLASLGLLALGIWKLRMQRQGREVAEKQSKPRLSVRVGEGFAGDEHQVTIYVVLNNDGSTNLHGVVTDALIDGKAVASSDPVDVPSGGTKTVDIHVARRYVVSLQGEQPVYTGEFSLRATDLSGTTGFFSE
jgi:hypothetical protein